MAKSLLIVESPAKARTINKYLGKDFDVIASVGHIKDLPKKDLSVDVENDFAPTYEVIKGKGQVIKEIRSKAKMAERVYLAPDPDREGEAIACHIAEEIKDKDKVFRVLFNEITKKAIIEALDNPLKLDYHRFEAQQARRILDRLVGYQISPILWDKVRRGLSAGRVQSVAVRLIAEREDLIRAFVSKEYWSVVAALEGGVPPAFEAKLLRIKGEKVDLSSKEETDRLLKGIEDAAYTITKITKKERKRNPSPPFITSTLQQEAARKLGFSAKKTMTLAQRLYEGIEFGTEGPVGLITYMRTDSTRIADEAMTEVRGYIGKTYGKEYLPKSPRHFKKKAKGAQDAHEAIRPTSMSQTPESAKKHLEKDAYRLYDLIWKRFVASQMSPAIFDQTAIDIEANDALFRATGSILRFPGFITLYQEGKDAVAKGKDDAEESEGDGAKLPDLKEGDALKLLSITPAQHFTEPPHRFTEATLVKELEEKGIGRPSTYAAIISNIQDREYVRLEKKNFFPTELGMLVNGLLVESFPDILDVEFTARMEKTLDEIEMGKEPWVHALKQFYKYFSPALAKAKKNMRNVKQEVVPTDIPCEKCGVMMVIKWGKAGEFIACPNYPECKNTSNFKRNEEGKIEIVVEELELTDEKCPKCKKPMVIRTGRYGRFLACSEYPECKGTKPITTGVKCPKCGQGEISERRSKKGKVFFGCTAYPKCDFASWDRPLPEKCPDCGAAFLVEKTTKRDGTTVRCLEKECGYSRSVEEQD